MMFLLGATVCNWCPKRTIRQYSSSTFFSPRQDAAQCWATRGDSGVTEIVLVVSLQHTNPSVIDKTDWASVGWSVCWLVRLWQRCTFLQTKAQLGNSIALLKWFCCKFWQSIWFELIFVFLQQWAKTSIVEEITLNLCTNYTAIIRVIDVMSLF